MAASKSAQTLLHREKLYYLFQETNLLSDLERDTISSSQACMLYNHPGKRQSRTKAVIRCVKTPRWIASEQIHLSFPYFYYYNTLLTIQNNLTNSRWDHFCSICKHLQISYYQCLLGEREVNAWFLHNYNPKGKHGTPGEKRCLQCLEFPHHGTHISHQPRLTEALRFNPRNVRMDYL